LEEATLDFSGIYGGFSGQSFYDPRLIDDALMDRVLFEPGVLEEEESDGRIEVWTRTHLLRWLLEQESIVHAPPLAAEADPRRPCPEGGCGDPAPTAVLHHLRFISAIDAFDIVVFARGLSPSIRSEGEAADDETETPAPTPEYLIQIRQSPDQPSLCGPDLSLDLGFVQLQAIVQRLLDDALVAQVNELQLLEGPPDRQVPVSLPAPSEDPAGFCAGVRAVYEGTDVLLPSDAAFGSAATRILSRGLGRLFPDDSP